MNRIDELTDELKKAITDSEEYKEFIRLTALIERYPDIKRAVDDYRRENFYVQYSDDVGDVMAATEELSRKFDNVKKQQYVERYLRAELCVCRMVQEVCMDIVSAIDINMDFLYDEF